MSEARAPASLSASSFQDLEAAFARALEPGADPREVIAQLELAAPDAVPTLRAMLRAHAELFDCEPRLAAPARAKAFLPRSSDERRPEGPNWPRDATHARARFIGDYRIIDVLGEGGGGMVYLAEEAAARRLVAVKIIHPSTASREAMQRFEIEQTTLAMLDHPNVVGALKCSTTADGTPYIVMPFVPGDPVTEFAAREALSMHDRVRLFLQACRGVQHAHANGVIHRDLKPGNILAAWPTESASPRSQTHLEQAWSGATSTGDTSEEERAGTRSSDSVPRVVVIDFGLAKASFGSLGQPSLHITHTGQIVGTPRYMSPEQRAGRMVDARSDVFSLGVILHELLRLDSRATHVPPSGKERQPKSAKVEGSAPPEQWVVPSKISAQRVARELDWICMRCLEAEPDRRYATVAALAGDIDAWLTGAAVQAGPPARIYRARQWIKRNKLLVASLSIVAFFLAASGGVFAGLAYSERLARERAELTANFAAELLRGIDPAIAQGRDRELLAAMLDDALRKTENSELPDRAREELEAMVGIAFQKLGAHSKAIPMLERAHALAATRRWSATQRFELLSSLVQSLGETGYLERAAAISDELVLVASSTNRPLDRLEASLARLRLLKHNEDQVLAFAQNVESLLGPNESLTLRAWRLYARKIFRHDTEHGLAILVRMRERAEARYGPTHPIALADSALESWGVRRMHGVKAQNDFILNRLDAVDRVLGRLDRNALLLRTNLAFGYAVQGHMSASAEQIEIVLRNAQERGDREELSLWVTTEQIRCLVLGNCREEAIQAVARRNQSAGDDRSQEIANIIAEGYDDISQPHKAADWRAHGLAYLSGMGWPAD
ncbi:MAG: serine/threonine-protein kinase [Planctomycetota bacterium]|nr:serine/threonine-protein kinase [Planctomycetota bacterium]